MKISKKLTLLIGLMFLASCAMMMEQRSFVDEMDFETDGFFVPNQDFEVMPGDEGQAFWNDQDINQRTPASTFSSKERLYTNSLKKELKYRESKLPEGEYRRYLQDQEFLETDSEKIYYLKLSYAKRSEYLSGKSLNYSYNSIKTYKKPSLEQRIYEDEQSYTQGVSVGMKKQDVRESWGRPYRIDVAGNPEFENERWIYNKAGKTQVVYFENGMVNGWSMD